MLTVKTAAARLNCCVSVVYDLVNCGSLPHYRIGKNGCRGAIRIAEADLEAFLVAQKSETGPSENRPTPKRKIVLKHFNMR